MNTPDSISFTDLEVQTSSLFRRSLSGPTNLQWTRVRFTIPNGYDAPQAVSDWLADNTPGRFDVWFYQDPKSRDGEYRMVVNFEDKNDALMFKLRGGHQAWENQ